MRDFKLLIFDWDGTLADSVNQIVQTMQSAIEALQLPPRNDQQIGELIGLGFADGLRRLYPDFDPQSLMQLIFEYRRQAPFSAYTAPLFDGAAATLRMLSTAGYHLAVATGKSREGLDRSLQGHQGIAPLFATTRCADETADKPDPLMLAQILDELGLDAAEALMIGDTDYDVSMAQAIGMASLGVATGAHDPGRLLQAGARAVVEDVRAIPAWLGLPASPRRFA